MKAELRKRLLLWAFLLGGPLTILSIMFPVLVGQVGTYVFASVWISLMVVFIHLAWKIFKDDEATPRSAHFVIGIAITSVAMVSALVWTIAAYIFGDQWMLTSPIVGIYIIMGVFGGGLLLTTPDRNGHVPPAHRRILWTSVVIGLLAGIATVVFDLERGLALAPL